MTLTVIVPAECNDFTTLANVKAFYDITDTNSDVKINMAIKYASDYIRSVTGRVFAEETVLETVRGFDNTKLMLQRYPITNIDSIVHRGDLITDYQESDPKAGILYRRQGWEWSVQTFRVIGLNPAPESEDYVFGVTYTAGYCMPCAVSCVRTLPYDLEQVAIELIGLYLDPTPLNVSQIKVGDYSTSYRAGVPESILAILKSYTPIHVGN